MRRGPWFSLDDLYGRYYSDAREGVGQSRSDTDSDRDADANADEEGDTREGGDMGEHK